MQFWRHYRSFLLFVIFLVVGGVLVIRQIGANERRHVELREAFILLYTKGYHAQAEHLYQRLLIELEHLPDEQLLDDFQRTLAIVDTSRDQPNNLIWKYHWTVSNEMEKRSVSAIQKALKLANEE